MLKDNDDNDKSEKRNCRKLQLIMKSKLTHSINTKTTFSRMWPEHDMITI